MNRHLAVYAVEEVRRTPGIPDKVPLQLRNRENNARGDDAEGLES